MMTLSSRTPSELIEGLRQREPEASVQLAEWLREPVARLMEAIACRHALPHDPDDLTTRSLEGVETYLRSCRPEEFAGMSVRAFRAAALAHLVKVALTPVGHSARGPSAEPGTLPACPDYETLTLFFPLERVGEHWFGGDWVTGGQAADGALWVFLADVTGHGYYAHLLAAHLPNVWDCCWADFGAVSDQPFELLTLLHDALEECLPEGVFVEACLARLTSEGQLTVASAGGTRLLLRADPLGQIALHKVRGPWLGLAPPDEADQRTWTLRADSELLLGSDGLFDQLNLGGQPPSNLRGIRSDSVEGESLLDIVLRALREALQECPQRDDISAVSLRRRTAASYDVAARAGTSA